MRNTKKSGSTATKENLLLTEKPDKAHEINKANYKNIFQQRDDLEKTNWRFYLKISGVTNERQMQMVVLFRLLRSMAWEDAHRRNDYDAKTSINHQQAVFEKALEMESMIERTGLKG